MTPREPNGLCPVGDVFAASTNEREAAARGGLPYSCRVTTGDGPPTGFEEPPRLRPSGEVRLSRTQVASALAVAADGYLAFSGRPGAYGGNGLERHVTGHLGEMAAADWFELRGYHVRRLFAAPTAREQADLTVHGTDNASDRSTGADGDPTLGGEAGAKREPPRGLPAWVGRRPLMPTGPEYIGRRRGAEPSRAVRVEVKTWRAQHWERYGRSLAARQVERVAAKADVLVWCTVPESPPRPHRLLVQGWTSTAEYLAAARPVWRPGWAADLTIPADVVRSVETMRDPETWLNSVLGATPVRCAKPCGHDLLLNRFCWRCLPLPDDAPPWVLVSSGRGRMYHQATSTAVRDAHDGWPFRTLTKRIPFGDAAVHFARCWRCFPTDHDHTEPPALLPGNAGTSG